MWIYCALGSWRRTILASFVLSTLPKPPLPHNYVARAQTYRACIVHPMYIARIHLHPRILFRLTAAPSLRFFFPCSSPPDNKCCVNKANAILYFTFYAITSRFKLIDFASYKCLSLKKNETNVLTLPFLNRQYLIIFPEDDKMKSKTCHKTISCNLILKLFPCFFFKYLRAFTSTILFPCQRLNCFTEVFLRFFFLSRSISIKFQLFHRVPIKKYIITQRSKSKQNLPLFLFRNYAVQSTW